MAENTVWVPASPEDCWSIVADARGYAFWVIGADDVEHFDGDWPDQGATFHHAQGAKPVRLHDTTSVLACDPPRRLELEVRARPLFVGIVTLTFTPRDGGTDITINERATGGLAGLIPDVAASPLIAMRNAESVRRLAAMAWARATAGPTHAPQPGAERSDGGSVPTVAAIASARRGHRGTDAQ